VTAKVWNQGKESIVVYRLNQVNGQWKAWDMIIDDLSTVTNYREQFRRFLQDDTLDNLIARLRENAAG
jgi:phospholipid transport system substrate-binding protein